MVWFRANPGGENNAFDINTDHVEYVEYTMVGEDGTECRIDAVLHMGNGKKFAIDSVTWEVLRGHLVPLTRRVDDE